jgi:hypothetical protein
MHFQNCYRCKVFENSKEINNLNSPLIRISCLLNIPENSVQESYLAVGQVKLEGLNSIT